MIPAVVIAWLIVVTAGMAVLWRHALTAGPVAQTHSIWPANLSFAPNTSGYTLVMTLHPECPCSRASVDELAVLMTRCHGKIKADVLFAGLIGPDENTRASDLWKTAGRIDGVSCVLDREAAMIARFGGEISGQVFLYDAAGVLQFSGGITEARGHEGDNAGLESLCSIVNGRQPLLKTAPVYGCRIR